MADNYLTEDPNSLVWGKGEYKGTGGGPEAQKYYAYKKFAELFGRNPTAAELNMLAAGYDSGDINKANVSGGNAIVSQYYNQKTNTPEKQFADQEAAWLEKAPEFYDQINSQFQSTIGRDATQEERDHFGKLMASGQADQYQLGQFLTQLPENVRKQDEEFRGSLRDTIKAEDSRYFNEQLMPGIQSQFAKQGRSVDSSGFANALAQAGQQQNTGREDFLTNLTASQYTGNKANAYNEYINNVGRLQAGQDYSRGRRDQLTDALTGRLYDVQNFAMQKQSYDDYLKRYGKRSNGPAIGSLIGGLVGAGAGGIAGGGPGAAQGFSMGSSFGSTIGGLV